MNLRQKRKHYKYSYRYFVAWFSVHDENFPIPCPKKYKKTLKKKLKKLMIMMNVVESIGYTRNFMAIFQNLRKKKR